MHFDMASTDEAHGSFGNAEGDSYLKGQTVLYVRTIYPKYCVYKYVTYIHCFQFSVL